MERKLKLGLFSFFIILSNFQLFAQSIYQDSLKQDLIGTWKFVELRDKSGVKVDTIQHKHGYELASGPLTTYRADGTYSKEFTPQFIDNGKWYYDSIQESIIQFLYYKKPYDSAAKYLISKGHAKQDTNGDYYEVITDKVLELNEKELIILEREERQTIYRKINQ